MNNKHLPYNQHLRKILAKSTCVYSGTRFDVNRFEHTSADGTIIRQETVVHPGAVIILPLFNEDSIVMIRNERFSVDETLWELPAGTQEPGEQPQATAAREIVEETGYEAKNMQYLTVFYTSPGYCNEAIYAYCAKDLTYVGQKLDETEKITTEIVNWDQALDMVRDGTIRDSKTMLTLLFFQQYFRTP